MVAGSPIMSSPSHAGHSDSEGRDRHSLPSFAQAFPSSPSSAHPPLANTPADTPSASTMPFESQKRKRDDDSMQIKSEEDEEVRLPDEPPVAGPSKRSRSRRNSTSHSPPQPVHAKTGLSRPKHTLSGHSILNDTPPQTAQAKFAVQSLPSPASFALRRAALASRKAAPTSLTINPPVQTSAEARGLGLEPAVRSAPPVPASRLRLHQVQTSSQAPSSHQAANSAVPSISKVRFGATYETHYQPSKVPQPPKTAGLIGSSSHTAGGAGIQTIVQPPTPSTAGGSAANLIPLVPPTPRSLRHTLNQAHVPRVAVGQPTTAPSAADVRAATQSMQLDAKQAFLQPFESFYSALVDAKALKDWLGDQLSRSHQLLQQLAAANGVSGSKSVDEVIELKFRSMRSELDFLRDRVTALEETLTRSGVAVPPVSLGHAQAPGSQKNSSRANGSARRSPITVRERELPLPPISGNSLRGDPYGHHRRPSSHSPSASQTVLPPASTLTKMSTSSSRLDPSPSRSSQVLPSIGRSGRIPSPLGGSPLSEGEDRRENRRSHEVHDKDERMDTT